ncbi:MAG: 3'-5' exonuclease [Pseudomonadota bacterium]
MTFLKDPILVFDIETIPDVVAGRIIQAWPQEMADKDVISALEVQRLQTSGTTFLQHHLHQIVAISVLLCTPDEIRVWSLGETNSAESDIIQRFFKGIERFSPTLVSWNGSGFDLPVLHYRAMRHAIAAPAYWDMGENLASSKWNNYLNRYHFRHLDLMDLLASYQARAYVPLDQFAQLLGFPGKLGMSGGQVSKAYHDGKIAEIRAYCETDVVNTFLVYLRFEHFRGRISHAELQATEQRLRTTLQGLTTDAEHWQTFLDHWQQPQNDISQ